MAQNNAQRTSERVGISGYADYGITGDFRDAAYIGAAALKGRDPATGLEVEVFSISGQAGGENEVQAGMARVGVSGKHGSISAEFLTARGNGGAHNDDGSVGFNSGLVATGVGIEGTLVDGADSATLGVAVSWGASFSIGVRDIDANGEPELCVKGSVGFLTAGLCVED
jgi:hypothetical protein